MAVYLEEVSTIDRGGKEALLDLVVKRLAPLLQASRGMRLVWAGSTIGSTGPWPETIALWELRDWAHWADVVDRAYTDRTPDEELARLWREAHGHRLRVRSRTLVPASFCRPLDELLQSGFEATAFSFLTLGLRPGSARAALETLAAEEHLLGAWEVAFTNDSAVALFAHATLADLVASGYSDDGLRERLRLAGVERWTAHWGFGAPGTLLWPKRGAAGGRIW